ncbi:MAG: glycosyltransferase [Candidatus Sulfotelmatobacter sp.]
MHLAVLSNERLNPWVNWTTLGPPLLKPLAAYENARLVAPPNLALDNFRQWKNVWQDVRSSDTVFWMQSSSRPEKAVHLASLARPGARRSAFVVDAWKYSVTKIGVLALLQHLNPCFVAFREGCEELKRRFPSGNFEWLPFGVDTEVFDSEPGERTIFAYWMGRRYEPLHQAMLRYCSERGLDYRYTQRGGEFPDPRDLGKVVGSCQYFMVTPPNLSHPGRTGGFSPFVMRYLEGLAAGARLLGVLPGSGEYAELLPLDAILQVAPDGSDLAAKLDADRRNPSAALAVENARTLVRSRHSWAKRAEQVFRRLSSGTATGFHT